MMTPREPQNDFLLELLTLQQDGRHAISAPSNWVTHEPLLEVPIDVDKVIDELQDAILVGSEGNGTARWQFFVGSPGNGKSAATGKLCRRLFVDKKCRVQDEEKGISIADLEPTAIPYAIDVYEGSNKFASARIVQDASVVRRPFSADVDPAAELLKTLKHAWEKGISLVVCANRGVLEKVHRDNHMNRDVNSTPWFKVVKDVVEDVVPTILPGEIEGTREFNVKKPVFQKVKIRYSHLDNQSLLLGRDTFAKLIKKATEDTYWQGCEACSAKGICPFKANRDWLTVDHAREQVLKLLTRAEVLSGQVIVFREALAILSLVLAGCPGDYDNVHPCDWVRDRAAGEDIFSLASRRIYMSLFASYCPHGLETGVKLRKQQLEAFRSLHEATSNIRTRAAIKHVVELHSPSTDVGATRLLGENGIIPSLDPCREALPSEFYDRWDSGFDAVTNEGACFTDIERACLSIWKEMEESLELVVAHSASKAHWALRRWSSNFLLHFGALLEGRSAWAEELDRFAGLVELLAKPHDDRTAEDKQEIRKLDSQLESLLNAGTGNQAGKEGGTLQLSETVTLAGEWVQNNLKPKTEPSAASGSVSLAVRFGGGEKVVFAAPIYLWLIRRVEGKLDACCFPRELLAGVADARVRAAAKGKYAFENDDVELAVDVGAGERFSILRLDGDVFHERDTISEDRK